MPVVNCPNCRTELEIDDADFGYRMQCPACHSAFTPDRSPAQPPPPPLPPPPPAESDTLVVTCPRCQGKVGVGKDDLGHDMRCPLCDRVFTATTGDRSSRRNDSPPWRGGGDGRLPRYDDDKYERRRSRYDDEDDDDRPRRRRRSRYDDDDTPDDLIAYAKRECSAAGVGIIVIGVLTVLVGLLRIAAGALGGVGGAGGGGAGAGGPDEGLMMVIMIGYGVYSLVMGGFLVYAGTRMREAKNYGLCMIACVLSLIPGLSPCCILGLVFGIMGVTKLNDSRVKRGFEANKPEYDGDGYD